MYVHITLHLYLETSILVVPHGDLSKSNCIWNAIQEHLHLMTNNRITKGANIEIQFVCFLWTNTIYGDKVFIV